MRGVSPEVPLGQLQAGGGGVGGGEAARPSWIQQHTEALQLLAVHQEMRD